jgi:hypothetical protein
MLPSTRMSTGDTPDDAALLESPHSSTVSGV